MGKRTVFTYTYSRVFCSVVFIFHRFVVANLCDELFTRHMKNSSLCDKGVLVLRSHWDEFFMNQRKLFQAHSGLRLQWQIHMLELLLKHLIIITVPKDLTRMNASLRQGHARLDSGHSKDAGPFRIRTVSQWVPRREQPKRSPLTRETCCCGSLWELSRTIGMSWHAFAWPGLHNRLGRKFYDGPI